MATSISESGFQNFPEKKDQIGHQSADLQKEDTFKNSTDNLMDLLKNALADFNHKRQLSICNLPPTCTENDVNLLLGGYRASEINLNRRDNTAIVVLENGEEAESIVGEINGAMVSDNKVSVSVHNSNNFLCIAHLPHNFTEANFRSLLNQFGPVDKSFIFRAQDTGQSKFCGFVEFGVPPDQVLGIKNDLDWRLVGDVKVHCDNVSPNLTSYQKLNSKCLFVDNLPKDYTDNAEFREIFSHHTSPLYCQIVLKDGSSLGYGIIEYKSWEEAEKAERSLNGYLILNEPMRITYCIPGVSAVAICTRIMSKFDKAETVSKPSLLPDPVKPSGDIINNPLVKQLTKQHPNLMAKFDEALQQLQKTYVKQLTTKTDKPGLLGPAPAMPMNPLMSTNLQLGLMILLALQTQLQTPGEVYSLPVNLMQILGQHLDDEDDKTSLLGDPLSAQANIILQNLMAQVSPGKPQVNRRTEETVSSMLLSISQNYQNMNIGSLVKLGQLAIQINADQSYGGYSGGSDSGRSNTAALFDTKNRSASGGKDSSNGLLGAPPNLMPGATQNFLQNISMLASQKGRGGSGGTSLLGGGGGTSLLGEPPSNFGGMKGQGLLPDPSSSSAGRFGSGSQGSEKSAYDDAYKYYQEYNEYYDDGSYGYGKDDEGYYGGDDYYDQHNYMYGGQRDYDYRSSNSRDSTGNFGSQGNKYQNMAAQAAAYAASNSNSYGSYGYGGYSSYSSASSGYGDYQGQDSSYQSRTGSYQGQDDSYTSGYNSSVSSRGYDDSFSSGFGNMSRLSSSGSVTDQSCVVGYRGRSQYSTMPPPPPGQTDGHGGYDSSETSKTPHGQKRNYSQLLPPPEPSPEGDYVGQHSQGIGGHYAESYYNKRQKLDNTRTHLQY